MKYFFVSLLIILSGCTQAQKSSIDEILIVYLSRTNNTKAVAEMIHKQVGGKLVALELVTPYPENYRSTVAQVVRENETGYLPPLKNRIDNIENYKTIFLGFPTWGMKLPPPVKTFLTQYKLNNKKVILFNTNGGYGKGSSFETAKELCVGCIMPEGFSTTGGFENEGRLLEIRNEKAIAINKDVIKWLRNIKMIL